MPAARIQPQGRARLNSDNPLARGLFAAYDFAVSTSNIIDGLPLTSGGSSVLEKTIDRAGIGLKNTSTTGTLTFPDYSGKITTGATIIAVLRNQDTGNQGLWMIGDQTGNSDHYPYGGAIYSSDFMPNGSSRWVNGAAPVVPFTDPHVLSVQFKNGAQRMAQDGKTVATASLAQNPVFPNGSRLFLPSAGSPYQYTGAFKAVFIWNRCLSDAEVASIVSNPWQLFEGQPAMLSAAVAPAGGGATANPTGVSASSAVGSATVTGQAKASPAGVSAASSVGSATVSGQGKATPAGVPAASAVGTATASGAASSTAQPAGVSAVASVGAAAVSGQGKALPVGVSASASVGTALASGTAITTAYPAGVQAVAAVGSATAQGTATAAPLGVSSAIYVGTAYAYGPFDISSYPKLYATTLMRMDTVSRQGGVLKDAIAAQSAMRATQACNSLMRAQAINLTSAMRSDPINRIVNLL